MKRKTDYLVYFSLGLILMLIVASNFMIQGITCNDEVQLRLNSQHGLVYFLKKQIIEEDIYQGRVLGALGNVKFLSFLSTNIYVFRAIEILIMLCTIGVFGLFVFKAFNDRKMAAFSVILTLVFLPITFEHAVPNAFVIVVCQPLLLLLLSLIAYLQYLEMDKKRYIVASCLLFFWGCCLYEFVVTYILLFIAIAFLKQIKRFADVAKKSLPHVVTAVIYLICYVLQGKIFPTNYSGTELNIFNIRGILQVLKIEWMSALPGYYLFNKKYKYLHGIYSMKFDIFNVTVIIVFFICLATILIKLLKNNKFKSENIKKKFIIFFIAIAYTIIPTIPNAITPLYQENVSENYFTSIPVSFLYILP